jgi:hypothetical protein
LHIIVHELLQLDISCFHNLFNPILTANVNVICRQNNCKFVMRCVNCFPVTRDAARVIDGEENNVPTPIHGNNTDREPATVVSSDANSVLLPTSGSIVNEAATSLLSQLSSEGDDTTPDDAVDDDSANPPAPLSFASVLGRQHIYFIHFLFHVLHFSIAYICFSALLKWHVLNIATLHVPLIK